MQGFGFFSRIDELKDKGKELEKSNLVEPDNQLTDEQENELNNVAVITLDDGEYKASGSAGNKANNESDEVEPQLGGMGLGTTCGLKKELARTEAFQGAEVVDDASREAANDIADNNKIEKLEPVTKIDDMFSDLKSTFSESQIITNSHCLINDRDNKKIDIRFLIQI